MFKLDNDFLTSLGLGTLPVEEKNKLLQHIYERLEMNVGMRLAERMTDAQLDEFEGFIDRNDEAGALRWLETNFPNYKDVVAEELEKLKREVGQAAPQILAAAQAQPASQQNVPPSLNPYPEANAPLAATAQPFAASQPSLGFNSASPQPLQPAPDMNAQPAPSFPPQPAPSFQPQAPLAPTDQPLPSAESLAHPIEPAYPGLDTQSPAQPAPAPFQPAPSFQPPAANNPFPPTAQPLPPAPDPGFLPPAQGNSFDQPNQQPPAGFPPQAQ